MDQVIAWLTDPAHWSDTTGVPNRVFEHLYLCALSLGLATLLAFPVALYIGHTGKLAGIAVNVANIGRAIPSYAMMGILLPVSLALAPVIGYDPGLGLAFLPVFGAMTLLAIPPILVQTWAGLRAVDRELIEAARGMGMTERRILTSIELPLASAVIVGGFRTATLQVIATATIGAIFAFGGLGRFIIDGKLNQDTAMLVSGAILVTVLAVVIDMLLAGLQRLLTPKALRAKKGRAIEEPSIDPTVLPTGSVSTV
jgi:osmoprotectant transport system permease protein